MTEHTTPSLEIVPYINPAYWGGTMIGQPNPRVTREKRSIRRDVRTSVLVEEYLKARNIVSPVKLYPEGEVIDPNEYRDGTLFYANRELLLGGAGSDILLAGIEPYETDLTPPRDTTFKMLDVDDIPNELEHGFSRLTVIKSQELGVAYVAVKSFVVVLQARKGNVFHMLDQHKIFRKPDGVGIKTTGEGLGIEAPITLGAVDHTRNDIGEKLHRVNNIVMCREQQQPRGKKIAFPAIRSAFRLGTT